MIDTPPPYPSGRPWHIGAAAHYAQIDMIARTAIMNGKNVLFPIGIDRNGLPVEIYTEKKHKVRMRQMDREKFLELCKVALDDLDQWLAGCGLGRVGHRVPPVRWWVLTAGCSHASWAGGCRENGLNKRNDV